MPKRSTAERWWSSSGEGLPIATYLSMDITVILCTYNRSESLAKALASVAVQELSSGVLWEVLVIDNNSRDETPSVVRKFSEEYPGRFRYLFEPRPGKSFALNAGIQEAQG